ncbi:hypothetical protein [Microbacterium sp. USHLN272]|uniref:hypothetical protein n=1 Tax=Microbacterium sp. USHLN272 TaxID=3081287 RepID=UPI00301A0D25
MARKRVISRSARSWLFGVAVVVTAAVAIALTLLAFDHVQSRTPDGPETSAPVFAPATPSPSPSATDIPAAAPYDPATQRFIAVGDGVVWRGTAGVCGGTAPSLERSVDDGETWTDVLPEYLEIGQLLALDAFDGSQAEIVAGRGAACEVQLLRTFTQGEFWASYPDVLARSAYVDASTPRLIIVSGAPIEGPCDESHGLRRWGGSVAIVCGKIAYVLGEQTWMPLDVPNVLAIAPDGDDLVLASNANACDGIALRRFAVDGSSVDAGCVETSAPVPALALSSVSESITLWSGDDWIKLPR